MDSKDTPIDHLRALIGPHQEHLTDAQKDAINSLTKGQVQQLLAIKDALDQASQDCDGFNVESREDDKKFLVGIC